MVVAASLSLGACLLVAEVLHSCALSECAGGTCASLEREEALAMKQSLLQVKKREKSAPFTDKEFTCPEGWLTPIECGPPFYEKCDTSEIRLAESGDDRCFGWKGLQKQNQTSQYGTVTIFEGCSGGCCFCWKAKSDQSIRSPEIPECCNVGECKRFSPAGPSAKQCCGGKKEEGKARWTGISATLCDADLVCGCTPGEQKVGGCTCSASNPEPEGDDIPKIMLNGRNVCEDATVNQGSPITVQQTLHSEQLSPSAEVNVTCCSGKCSCSEGEGGGLVCESPYDDVIELATTQEVKGSVKLTKWEGFESECCGCSNSGQGNLHLNNEHRAILNPQAYAPLCTGWIDEGTKHCRWDFFACPACK